VLPREARHRQRPLRSAAGPLSRSPPPLAAVCAVVLLAACGAEDNGGGSGQPPATDRLELEVSLDPDGPGGKPQQSESISCELNSGCNEAAAQLTAEAFEPPPPQTACTEIFGGPETATIAGTLGGEPVEAELSRANGCEIERFERFLPLLTSLFPDYRPGATLTPDARPTPTLGDIDPAE